NEAALPIRDAILAQRYLLKYPAISPQRLELSAAGKTVVITGAVSFARPLTLGVVSSAWLEADNKHSQGSGIGRATAAAFAAAGASTVVLLGRSAGPLNEPKSQIPGNSSSIVVIPLDITDEAALNKASAAVGKWDVLVLAAGYTSTPGPLTEADTDDWWQSFGLWYTFLALKAFKPFTEPSHATVLSLITGTAALPAKALPNLSSYLASKAAQTKVIEFLPVENPNIFAAAIHSGMVETAIFT
ncbi:short chain dehydrogenase, partial [Diaporthe helianthi]